MKFSESLTAEEELALDNAIADYLERVDRDEEVDLEAFLASHGSLAPALREFLAAADLVTEIVSTSNVPAQVTQALKETTRSLTGLETLCSGTRVSSDDSCADEDRKSHDFRYEEPPPLTGVRFGRYLLLGPLGEGMTGSVHLAYDTSLERLVAIKIPIFEGALSGNARERFFRGARLAATLEHRHICSIYDVGEIDDVPYLCMAYIDGRNLAQVLEKRKLLPLPRVLEIIRKLAEALREAHARNVIHRDLKPANVMIDSQGEPIVTDFGMARRLGVRDTQLTHTGTLIGTPVFMSPEQIEGSTTRIGAATDIYSLGVIFYQMLTGLLPFNGTFISVAVQVRHGKPVPPTLIRPELKSQPGLENVCLKMMAKRPEDRYASMDDVVRAIEALERGETPSGSRETSEARPIAKALLQAEPAPPPIALPAEPKSSRDSLPSYLWCGIGAAGMLAIVVMMMVGGGILRRPRGRVAQQTPATQPLTSPPISRQAEKPKPKPTTTTTPPPVEQVKQPADPKPIEAPPDEELAAAEAPAGVVEPAAPVDEAPPPPAPAALAAKTSYQRLAIAGTNSKFGVVQVTAVVPDDERLRYRPDLPCRVTSSDGKVLYPAYNVELRADEVAAETEEPPPPRIQGEVEKVIASFLCLSDQPLTVDLYFGATKLIDDLKISVNAKPTEHADALAAWWADYNRLATEELNPEARQTKLYLQAMLARRLDLPRAERIPLPSDDASALERYFERSVSMFMGFDSVKSALGTGWSQSREREPLAHPLPRAPQIAPVPFSRPEQVSIEAIATHVPDDCVYLHCRSLSNYLWFRDLLTSWGGSLDEVVASRTRDRGIRQRLERQLALTPDEDLKANFNHNIDDLAVVFGDPFFEDGAAVGVLLQAKRGQGPALKAFLDGRRRAAAKNANVGEQQVTIDQDFASLVATSDKRIRSYYAVHGDYHFVTNSEFLARRFFQAGRGQRSLAKLEEYRYARSKVTLHREQTVFLYMSDPFFNRIISPACQIELARRAQAKADVQHLQLAHFAAYAEGRTPRWAKDLVESGHLPPGFGVRSDGSYAELGTTPVDSLRGAPGSFVPVCDMHVTKITRSEYEAYERFVRGYALQWRRMDPVSLVIAHRPLGDGREAVDIEITITPYAQQKYATLRNYLTHASRERIEPLPGDLLSMTAGLRTAFGHNFQAYGGLHDAELRFAMKDGRVRIAGLNEAESYAGKNYHLAFDRKDNECLWAMLEVSNSLGATNVSVARARFMNEALHGFSAQIVRLPLLAIDPHEFWHPRPSDSKPGWKIVSPREDLKQAEHRKVASADPMQARLQLRELQGSHVEPYIQAYTWLEARRASARNAALFDLTQQQFCLQPEKVPVAIERIHSAKSLCPLGGRYALNESAGGYASDRWTQTSLYDERQAPADYRFAFMEWLRGLDVGFALEEQTLRAEVKLEIQPNK